MSNELLLITETLIDFGLVLVLYRWLGKQGLLAWVCVATVLANIQVTKTIEVFGLTATLGNALYASVFLATDLLSEHYGKAMAQRSVVLGFVSMLVLVIAMSMSLWFVPADVDLAHESMETLFGFMPRVAIGSLLAYLASQFFDVHCYLWIRERLPGTRHLWIRNNVATIMSQALDTVIFTCVAFWGLYSFKVFSSIVLTTFALKLAAALLDTPFIYLSLKLKQGK